MGAFAGPDLSESGLVLALDAGNLKSYKYRPGPQDHGISDWYCFINGTATYSAIYPNTEIIEIDENGNETVMVSTGSAPQRGTFATTAGRRYYGTKAIHLLQTTASDDQHELAPVSFAGTYFAHRWTRNSPTTYYAFSPFENASLQFFDNNASGGVTGIVTATHNISKGLSTSFTSTAVSTWQFFKSDKPIIMTAGGSGADKTILTPATQYNYKRRNANNITINNTAPSTSSTYVTYDTSLPVVTVEIADGAGGDCTQGIGYEYLSDTYSWGDSLSDYQLVAPYADTTVTVSYWANGQWNVGEVHSLNGTQTSPAAVDRDGTNGFGVDGSTLSGGAAFLASGADLWKFEGTQPFALIINDTADDEERLLGWMSNRTLRTTSNSDQQIIDLSGNSNNGSIENFSNFNDVSLNRYITFDGVDDKITISHNSAFNLTSEVTVCAVVKQIGDSSVSQYQRITDKGSRLTSWLDDTDNKVYLRLSSSPNNFAMDYTFTQNQTYHIIWTYDKNAIDGRAKLYVNGDLKATNDSQSGDMGTNASDLVIGNWSSNDRSWNGPISHISIYNRALTAQEIQQNFNATRSRFGI